ncbi:MAG: hypothetical protein AAF618_05990 [Pseudomonadota bacterium]
MPLENHPVTRDYQVASGRRETVETIRFEAEDVAVLQVMRAVLDEMSRARIVGGSQRALHEAARAVQSPHAAAFLGSLQCILRELGRVRTSQFNFIPADDPNAARFVTREEVVLVRLLHFACADAAAAFQTQLIMLCEGGDATRVMSEAYLARDLIRAKGG